MFMETVREATVGPSELARTKKLLTCWVVEVAASLPSCTV